MSTLNLLKQANELGKTNRLDPVRLAALQDQKLRSMLRHARDRSPFYRARLQGLDLDRCKLTDIPPLTKEEMMASFDQIVTDPQLKLGEITPWLDDPSNLGKLYLGKYVVAKSSGSTGFYGVVVHDLAAFDTFNAVFFARPAQTKGRAATPKERLKHLVGSLLGKKVRLAVIAMAGVPLPAYTLSLFTPPLMKRLGERRVFSSMEPIDRLVAALNEFQPDHITAYPSVLELLALEKLAGRLKVPLDKPYSGLMAGSEPLTKRTIELSRQAWGLEVQDLYGALECIVIARSCGEFDRMHVMSDLCVLEVVDEHDRPVPDGQRGAKTLITNLFNKVQPIIRYEISDVTGYSTERCRCSWPFPTLLSVDGRTDDIFYLPRPGGGYEAVDSTRFFFILTFPDLKQSQLLQTKRDELTFKYVPTAGAKITDEDVRRLFEENLAKAQLAGRATLRIERVAVIPRQEGSGKFRHIMSLVGPVKDDAQAPRDAGIDAPRPR